MNLLLDTHAFLWFASGDRRIGVPARDYVQRDDAVLFLSAASVWELAIKSSRGRLTLPAPLSEYLVEKEREGYRVLSISGTHAAAVERLPLHHQDPFDRILAAQALAERMTLVTRDRVFKKYGVNVIW